MRHTIGLTCLLLLVALPAGPACAEEPFDSWIYPDMQRLEIGVGGGGTTNDPFLDRGYLTWNVLLHFHQLIGLDLRWAVSPDGGDSDRKPLTNQLESRNEVVPDLSRVLMYFTPGAQFTPLHAEDQIVGALDLSFFLGGGLVHTRDDEDLTMGGEEQYVDQLHGGFAFGSSIRIKLFDVFAFNFHFQRLTFQEQVSRFEGLVVEEKNHNIFLFQVSVLTPSFGD